MQDMKEFCLFNSELLTGRTSILMHVGTNDLCPKYVFDAFMDFKLGKTSIRQNFDISVYITESVFVEKYNQLLITLMSINPSAKILISAIVQRPYDFQTSCNLVLNLNRELNKFTKLYKSCKYVFTWKPFLDKSRVPKMHFFSTWDHLHLNKSGSIVLRGFFQKLITIVHIKLISRNLLSIKAFSICI